MRVDAKGAKRQRNHPGIEWSGPGSRARVTPEGRAKAAARRQRVADISHLELTPVGVAKAVRVRDHDVEYSRNQPEQYHPTRRLSKRNFRFSSHQPQIYSSGDSGAIFSLTGRKGLEQGRSHLPQPESPKPLILGNLGSEFEEMEVTRMSG